MAADCPSSRACQPCATTERAFSSPLQLYTHFDPFRKKINHRGTCEKNSFLTCDFELCRSGDDGANAVEGGHALVDSLVGAVGAGVYHGGEVEGPVRQESPRDQGRIKSLPEPYTTYRYAALIESNPRFPGNRLHMNICEYDRLEWKYQNDRGVWKQSYTIKHNPQSKDATQERRLFT